MLRCGGRGGHLVTSGAADRAGHRAAREMELMRTVSGAACRVIAVAGAARNGREVGDAVDVELRREEAAVEADHLGVTDTAVACLGMGGGWRQAVTGAAGFLRIARASPHAGDAAVTGRGAAARAEVVEGLEAAITTRDGAEGEAGAAGVVAFVRGGGGNAVTFGAGHGPVGQPAGEVKRVRADAGEDDGGVSEDVERWRGASFTCALTGGVTVTASA